MEKNFSSLTKKNKKRLDYSEKVERVVRILNLLEKCQYPSIQELADDFDVSTRTIQRDFQVIEAIGMDIEFVKEKNGYGFMDGNSLRKLNLNQNELILLSALGDISQNLAEPLQQSLHSIIQKISLGSDSDKSSHFPIAFAGGKGKKNKNVQKFLDLIIEGIQENRSVDITYKAITTGETTSRRIDPYGLINNPEGDLLVLGYCHLREDMRCFNLAYMKNIEVTYKRFDKGDFELNKYLEKSWGYYIGEEVTVKLRFKKAVSQFITSRNKWHVSEKRTLLDNGDVECEFTVMGGVTEIKEWAYSWLPNVEILEPAWFRKQVQEELKKSMNFY